MATKSTNKPVISATAVAKRYGLFDVLKDASFSIQAGEKVGLVGANGAGKSTLLKILTGEIQPDSGTITRTKGLTVGYVPQHFGDALDMTAGEFLASASGRTDASFKADIFTWFDRLSLAQSVLARPLRELSGGEKTKLALARIVLSNYDLFLLDEPTNNLDFEALGYLERFVKESGKAFLIVSHDRKFLDDVVSSVIEVSETDRVTRTYDGGFTDYMEERKARIEREWEAYEENKEAHDKLSKAIKTQEKDAYTVRLSKKVPDKDKFTAHFKKENAQIQFQKAANAMKTRLGRMDEVEKPKNELPLRVRFEVDARSGGKVFELAGVTKKLPEITLGPIDLLVSYGDRILITGENGSGKSTLVKILTGALAADSGTVVRGTGVHLGYLPQEEDFRADEGVMEAFARHIEYPESEARKILNRFRITAEDVKKTIGELSSGERSRLILATIMAKKANCLVLDEPSNHLDFEAMEEFEDALREFKGTLIVVSHDRYFIEKIGFSKAYKIAGGKLSSIHAVS